MSRGIMAWIKLLPEIKIRDYPPVTANSNPVAKKEYLCNKLRKKLSKKSLDKASEKSKGKKIMIDVCYYLLESREPIKDLDNLLKILFDVLSVNMANKTHNKPGLGLISDDGDIYKIKCEKKARKRTQGFDLKISYKDK